MSNILALSVIVVCAAPIGATTGYLIARRRSQAWAKAGPQPRFGRAKRLVLNLLGSIVGGVISSISSYTMVALGIPGMLVDWVFRIFGT